MNRVRWLIMLALFLGLFTSLIVSLSQAQSPGPHPIIRLGPDQTVDSDATPSGMWIWLPIPLIFTTLILLLRAEARTPRDVRQIKIWKPLTTVLVILVCILSFTRTSDTYDTVYTLLILVGLTLSLLGDWCLIFQDNARAFLAGLVAFLLAHLMYIAAFIYLQLSLHLKRNGAGETLIAIGLAAIGTAAYGFMRPGLGKMRVPVIVYVIAISVMVHRALAIALVHPGPRTQPALIALGAILFYLSDATLGINKFRFAGQMPNYKLMNLATYYTGQLLLALSVSFFT